MLTSSWLTRRRMVSTSCFLACTMIEFERRSGMISGARSADGPAAGSPPRGRAQAAAGEELGEDRRQLGGVGVHDRDDLQLFLRHLHVDQADDVEEPLD